MKKVFTLVLSSVLFISFNIQVANAAVKIGGACSKLGSMAIYKGTILSCKKNGSKNTWATPGQIQAAETSSLLSAPRPTSFDNLYKNRKGISAAAWSKFNSVDYQANPRSEIEIFIGPNTKPWNHNPTSPMSKVGNSFKTASVPKKVVMVYYSFQDLVWAKEKLLSLVSKNDFDNFYRNEGGRVTESNCDEGVPDCNGAKALMTQDGMGVLLMGVPGALDESDITAPLRFQSGMLEAHEYFHTLQDVPLIGKSLEREDFPPRWLLEGGAEFVQNATVNSGNFSQYLNFRSLDGKDLYQRNTFYTQQVISDYLSRSDWNEAAFMDYYLGARVVEIFVALNGQQSLLELNEALSTKIGFKASFKKVYGYEWEKAIPIIAKVVSARINEEK